MNEQEIFQCVQSQQEVFQSYDIYIPQSGLLAGLHKPVFSKTLFKNAFGEDNVHFPMGDAVLKYGVQGVLELTGDRRVQAGGAWCVHWSAGVHTEAYGQGP